MSNPATYNVTVSEQIQTFDLGIIEQTQTFHVTMLTGSPYEGDYTVTPSSETITLNTAGKTLVDDIVVNPIPSNYGLITWNGTTLTVS